MQVIERVDSDVSKTTTAPEAFAPAMTGALSFAWAAIRDHHGELPPAVLIVADAGSGRSKSWGHWALSRWDVAGVEAGEVKISGELFAPGGGNYPEDPAPVRVLGTLLHEAAHALATARGEKDTSRGGRYHNEKYKQLAEEVGLVVEKGPRHGWHLTRPSEEAVQRYRVALEAIEEALTGYRQELIREPKSSTGPLKALCKCPEPRAIRVSRKTYERGLIACGECRHPFLVQEEDEALGGDEEQGEDGAGELAAEPAEPPARGGAPSWRNLPSHDPRKPAAVAALRKAANVCGGRVTCVEITKDGTRVRGRVIHNAVGRVELEAELGGAA